MLMKKVRYAVVGLGHITQVAVLPAFHHARTNSQLSALVSGSRDKLSKLCATYGVKYLYDYDRYGECLKSGLVDAVYLALPNQLHKRYAIPALRKARTGSARFHGRQGTDDGSSARVFRRRPTQRTDTGPLSPGLGPGEDCGTSLSAYTDREVHRSLGGYAPTGLQASSASGARGSRTWLFSFAH